MNRIVYMLAISIAFIVPWENAVVLPGLGTISRLAGVLLAGVWLFTATARGEVRKVHVFHVLFAAFALWNMATIFWTIAFDLTMERMLTYVQLMVLGYILWDILREEHQIRAALQAYLLGCIVTMASVWIAYNELGGNAVRFTASGFNANDAGLIMALGLPIGWYLNQHPVSGRLGSVLRFFNLLFIPAAVMTILLTASRGSLIAVTPTMIFIIVTLARASLRIKIVLAGCAVAAVVVVLPKIPQASLARLSETTASIQSGNLTGRVDIWKKGLAELHHRPIIGVGSDGFRTVIGAAPHNAFLSVVFDTGFIGLTLLLLLWYIVLKNVFILPGLQRKFWLALLATLIIGHLELNWEQRKQTLLFWGLAVAQSSALVVVKRDESVK